MSNVDITEHGLDPGGGRWSQVDVSRREVVQLCGEKGLALFSFLLESSMMDPDQEEKVVFSLQRLHDVAVQLGWSPDTVKRYIAVFRAVNLVHHYHDCRREVRLHLPLGPYTPLTNFSALDDLVGKRKKLRQLALKIKMRYITRFGDPLQTQTDEMQQTLREVKAILENERLEPLKRERLQMKIADIFTRLISKEERVMGDLNALLGDRQAYPERQSSGTSFTQGDSNGAVEVLCSTRQDRQGEEITYQGDPDQRKGDLLLTTASTLGCSTEQMGDLKPCEGDLLSHALVEDGGYSQANQHEQGDLKPCEGDLPVSDSIQSLQKDGQLGDLKARVTLEEGDSELKAVVEVDIHAPYTYNVNYLISNITKNNVIRKQLAQFLASVLEKDDYDNGYPTFTKYLKAFKVYAPEVVGRAFLATMVLLHRKNWQSKKPGATFTDQCKILSGQLPFAHYTLNDVEEWMRTWGGLPYSELIEAIAIPLAEQQTAELAQLVIKSHIAALPKTKSALPGYIGNSAVRKKRTYGVAYTGRPVTVNKGIHNLSGPTPPTNKS